LALEPRFRNIEAGKVVTKAVVHLRREADIRLAQRLAVGLVGRTFRLKLGIAGQLAGGLLDRALGLVGGTFDPVLVHHLVPVRFECKERLADEQVPGFHKWRRNFCRHRTNSNRV